MFTRAKRFGRAHSRFWSSGAAEGASKLVGDMVQYTRAQLGPGKHEGMLDILKGGLELLKGAPAETGAIPRSRLYLAMAEVQADRTAWLESAEAATRATEEVAMLGFPQDDPCTPAILQVQEEASRSAVRAMLASARDDMAWDFAQMAKSLAVERYYGEYKPPDAGRVLVETASMCATVALAREDFALAETLSDEVLLLAAEVLEQVADSRESAAQHGDQKRAKEGDASSREQDAHASSSSPDGSLSSDTGGPSDTVQPNGPEGLPGSVPPGGPAVKPGSPESVPQDVSGVRSTAMPLLAFQQCAGIRYIQGDRDAAKQLYQHAISASEDSPWAQDRDTQRILIPPPAVREALASTWMGIAQLAIDEGDFQIAEEALEIALAAAEGVSGPDHPRVVPVLLLLATVLARTGRAQLAEGMYRGSAIKINLRETSDLSREPPRGLHKSIASMLCCRYSQLLAALPKREKEVSDWQAKGKALMQACRGEETDMEQLFGPTDALRPGGRRGQRIVTDVFFRRAFFRPPGPRTP